MLYDFTFLEYLKSLCFRCSVIARPLLWVECEMFYTGWIFEYLIPSGWYGFIRLKTGLVWQTQVSRRESIHKCSLLPSTKMNKVSPSHSHRQSYSSSLASPNHDGLHIQSPLCRRLMGCECWSDQMTYLNEMSLGNLSL